MKKTGLLLLCAAFAFASCGNRAAGNQDGTGTVHLTKAEFLTKVADIESNPSEWKYLGDRPALIDFYASWCGPCKVIAPILEELAAEYGDRIHIYKVDVDQEKELAAAFGINSIPTLLFVPRDGEPRMTQGLMSRDELKRMINEVLLNE